jgi:hypothetical protein
MEDDEDEYYINLDRLDGAIRNLLSEHNLRGLYEAWGQVNNMDQIIDDLIEFIDDGWDSCKSTIPENEVFTDSNGRRYNCPHYIYKCPFKNSYVGTILVTINYYAPQYQQTYNLLSSTILKNSISVDYRIRNGIRYYFHDLILSLVINRGKPQLDKIRGVIAHEITHCFQSEFNDKTHNPQGNRKFHNYYSNILNYLENNNPGTTIYTIVQILYGFIKTELTANLNKLRQELESGGVNRKNSNFILANCICYKQYKSLIENFNTVMNNGELDWDDIRKTLQDDVVAFDLGSAMAKATTGAQFKKALHTYLSNQINYYNKSVTRTVNYVTGYNKIPTYSKGKVTGQINNRSLYRVP